VTSLSWGITFSAMPDLSVYIASDVHLGATPSSRKDAFHAWLSGAAERTPHIILNGDLFDFWFEFRRGVPRGHEETLALLREITTKGTHVTLMGGNHDWWAGRYLAEEIGLELLHDPTILDLAGFRTLLAHGDGLGRGDVGYAVLRWVLRSPVTRGAFSLLSPSLGARIARGVSRTEDRWGEPTPADEDRSAALEKWATATLRDQPALDVVLLGHTHIPRLLRIGPDRWYVNSGDWVHNQSYVVLREGELPEVLEWRGWDVPPEPLVAEHD